MNAHRKKRGFTRIGLICLTIIFLLVPVFVYAQGIDTNPDNPDDNNYAETQNEPAIKVLCDQEKAMDTNPPIPCSFEWLGPIEENQTEILSTNQD